MQGQIQQRRGSVQRRQNVTPSAAEVHNSPVLSNKTSQSNRQVAVGMPISPPIYFLVREQAKSLVAIKELKDRVKNLEQVQEDVFEAVHELRLDNESRVLQEASTTYPGLVGPNSAMYGTNRKSSVPQSSRLVEITNGRFTEVSVPANSVKKKEEFGKGDNDPENKQDSGVDSDCQVQMSLNPMPQPGSSKGATCKDVDESVELMKVLDDIEVKSLRMRIQIHDQEQLLSDAFVSEDKSNLAHTCRSLQLQVRDLRKENETVRKRAELAERYVEKLTFDRSLMDSKMELILAEKKQLENTIHELHKKFVKSQLTSKKTVVSFQEPSSTRPRSLEDSKSKMSSILKEKNVLELQRQLLACILENEVLATKVEEAEKLRVVSAKESELSLTKLRRNIDKLMREKSEFGKLYDNKRRELDLARQDLTSARGKVGRLEKDLNVLNQCSDLDLLLDRTETSDTASFIDFSEQPKSKGKSCLSLPPVLYSNGGANHHFLKDVFTTDGAYTDIEESVTPFLEVPRRTSKLNPSSFLTEGITASQVPKRRPSLLQVDKSDLDSICSEFDPLSQSVDEDKGSKVDFEDSLDMNASPVSPAKDARPMSRMSTQPRIMFTNPNIERYLTTERRRVPRSREEPANISQLLDLSIDEELL